MMYCYFNLICRTFIHNSIYREVCCLKYNISLLIYVTVHVLDFILVVYVEYGCVGTGFDFRYVYGYFYGSARLYFFAVCFEVDVVSEDVLDSLLFFLDGCLLYVLLRFLAKFDWFYNELSICREVCFVLCCDCYVDIITLVFADYRRSLCGLLGAVCFVCLCAADNISSIWILRHLVAFGVFYHSNAFAAY